MATVQRFKTSFIGVPKDWKELKHHPFACIIEFGVGINLDALANHMREFGYDCDESIIVWRESSKKPWQILAGRHRQAAAILAEVVPSFKFLEGNEAIAKAYALKDALRRQLTVSQLAMIVAQLATLQQGQHASKNSETHSCVSDEGDSKSIDEVAAEAGISPRSVDNAKKVIAEGTPELQAAVMDGTITVTDAAKVASQSPEVQNAAVDAVKEGTAATATGAARRRRGGGTAKPPPAESNGQPEEEEPTDEEGMPVPKVALEAFKQVEEFNSLCKAIDAAAKRVKAIGDGPAGRLTHVSSMIQTLQSVRKMLWQSRPTHVCPYCLGDVQKPVCNCCKGAGWTNTATWKQSPPGAQA